MILVLAAAVKNIKNVAEQMFKKIQSLQSIFFKKKYLNIIFCIITGLLAAFSFPKIDLFFLAWVAFIPLIYTIMRASPKVSFFYGLLSGFVFNAVGLYWLIIMLEFNTGSYIQSFIAAFALWLYLALYWGIWGWLISKAKKYLIYPWTMILFAACTWVILEYIRTYFLTGFPWMLIGYSQYKFTEIIQIAEFAGIYGVSFLIILCNMLLYYWLIRSDGSKKYFYIAISIIVFFAVFGAFRLDKFKFFGDKEFSVSVVQPNIDQYKKWDQDYKDDILYELERYAKEISEYSTDLVVWPETVIPDFLPFDSQSYGTAGRIAQISGGMNIMGAPYTDGTGRLFNTVLFFEKDSNYKGLYKKQHLVPFGEFVPFRKQLGKFFGILNEMGDFEKGKAIRVFSNKNIFVGSIICSENFFPHISRKLCLKGAKVLTNHTNDAWFFDTAAPYQHFIMNVFRAVENRKAVLVSANSGISGIIEASGRICSTTTIDSGTVLTGTFLQNDYMSFYTKYGDVFIKACIIVFVIFTMLIIIL